jgi:hypothetical protein
MIHLQQIEQTHAQHFEDDTQVIVGHKMLVHPYQRLRIARANRIELRVSA